MSRFGSVASGLLACVLSHPAFAQSPPDAAPPPDASTPADAPLADAPSAAATGSGAASATPGGAAPATPSPQATPPPAPDTPATVTGLPRLPDQVGSEIISVTGSLHPTNSLLEPDPIAASDIDISERQLELRPHRRAEDLTQEVPGLFTVQHAGGGKAQQYFMRGFDLDHGTDLASFVDGVPINAVSHAHGQGYTDLHFIIPETVDNIEATKGPYSALVGDFAVAGSMAFHIADHIDESLAKVEIGEDGHERAVVVESPDLGPQWRAMVAAEVFKEDGPFIHPEDYVRQNAVTKITRVFDDGGELTTEAMAYGGTWNMSGVLPARAVCGEGDGTPVPAAYAGNHCISRWDSIDPSQGGESERYMLDETYRRPIPRGTFEATAFTLHSNLQLYPNDGIAAPFQPDGERYGSQVEQDDDRWEVGVNVRARQTYTALGQPVEVTYGLQLREDVVDSELHRTEDRVRLDGLPGIPGPIEDSGINETEQSAYVEASWRPVPWLRGVVGGRADDITADVSNLSPVAVVQAHGYRGAAQGSPKVAVVATPDPHVDLFANFGQGFHSNDIRTVVEGQATTLIARATGGEVGTAVRPIPGLSISALVFLLDLTSEETIDGDTASTSPAGPTQRYGTEETLHYQFKNDVFVQATYTYAHSRYTDEADILAGTTLVTLAPHHTFSAGAGAFHKLPHGVTGYASVDVRAMSDRDATQNDGTHGAGPPLIATGFAVVNGMVGVRYQRWDLGLDMINIGNEVYREGQFAVQSRLPGEGPNPPVGISFTPGVPRLLMAHLALRWR